MLTGDVLRSHRGLSIPTGRGEAVDDGPPPKNDSPQGAAAA